MGGNQGSIYDSHATGDVYADSTAGGFSGMTYGVIENCYSTGNVISDSANGTNLGGFTGSGSGTIKNSMLSLIHIWKKFLPMSLILILPAAIIPQRLKTEK